jgi:broad specificity phosphatase PhoE
MGVPARQWRLTVEGQRRCDPLAAQLTPYNLDLIVTSTEPKAIETGELAAQKLGIPCQIGENLHEHERETAPYFDTQAEFIEAVKGLLSNPDQLVFGDETGLEARDRFAEAVETVMGAYPRENIAIVTHGTVLSLFVSQLTGCATIPFWRGLGMPAIVAFSYPAMKLLAQLNEIT